MASVERSGTCRLGDLSVNRLGYGAMQLSGPGIFGPPRDREMAFGDAAPITNRDGDDNDY